MLKQEEKISQSISEIQQFEQDMKGIVDYCESEWLSIEDDKDRKSVYDMASKYTKEALETFAAHVDILSIFVKSTINIISIIFRIWIFI